MVVYDFYAPWCVPCKRILPLIERMSSELNIPIKKINVEESRNVFEKYKVKTVPTLILVDGEKEINRVINPKNFEEVRSILV